MKQINALNRRFVDSSQAAITKSQHKKPCADCPFSRKAIPGWTGLDSPETWIEKARGEVVEICHCTKNQQCAGFAIFRANVCKLPKLALVLPSNTQLVFASDAEFLAHHHQKLKSR